MSKISLDPKEEENLVKRARKAHTKAGKDSFGKLYQHYHPHIRRFFSKRLSDEILVEDLTSEVFEKALKSIDSFQWQGTSFSAWLYKIARNLLIDYFRQSDKRKKTITLSDIYHLPAPNDSPEDRLIEFEMEIKLHHLLETLTERERRIVYLKFFEGYPNKLIAEILEITETNVATILYRVVRKLREELGPQTF